MTGDLDTTRHTWVQLLFQIISSHLSVCFSLPGVPDGLGLHCWNFYICCVRKAQFSPAKVLQIYLNPGNGGTVQRTRVKPARRVTITGNHYNSYKTTNPGHLALQVVRVYLIYFKAKSNKTISNSI